MNEDKIIKALLKKAWLIALFTIICTGITGVYLKMTVQPKYQAISTMYVMSKNDNGNNSNITSDNISVSQSLVKDYAELIKSDKVVSAAMDKLGVTGLTSKVSISSKEDTNILELSVIDGNPEKAQDVANVFAQVFIEKILGITNQNDISIIDKAKTPRNPMNTTNSKTILTAFLISLLLISGVVILIEYLDNNLRTVEDIEKEVGYAVIGVIPEMNIK